MKKQEKRNMTADDVIDFTHGLLFGTKESPGAQLVSIKVPIDPDMHQRSGHVLVPISIKALHQILEGVHRSARYHMQIETNANNETVLRVYGEGQLK